MLSSQIEYVKHNILRRYLNRTITTYAKVSGCSFDRAESYIYDSNCTLNQFVKSLAIHSLDFYNQIKNEGQEVSSILTDEIHFGSTQVLLSRKYGKETVLYSKKRAHNDIFFNYINWFSNLLSIDLTPPRQPITPDNSSISVSRPYLINKPICDLQKASYNSGCLLAACQLLSVTDLHSQNVIFNNDIPIVIDDECICQPARESQIAQLKHNRKDYVLSTYRSLLLYDPHIPSPLSAECGFYSLFTNGGVNLNELLNGYIDGINKLRARQNELYELLDHLFKENHWLRYLIRSTRFYDLLKEQLILAHIQKKSNTEIIDYLKSLFETETDVFPELSECINNEIRQLLSFSTPYYIINTSTGGFIKDTQENVKAIIKIESPKKMDEEYYSNYYKKTN